MDPAISRQLVDKMYEKRKAAALDLEKQIRECHAQGDQRRIIQIIDQLVEMFSNSSNPLHVKNGGLIGLAGAAIALGIDVAPYMDKFINPLLDCFSDPENRIRYFSAECLYNIAKVSKGEILVYFNSIFDALSKLAADSELSVKNGAELLDRLLKDIVAESASVYVPQYAETGKTRNQADQAQNPGILVSYTEDGTEFGAPKKAFSLANFIPLLSDRIYVVSPFTRSFLVSWITVLDSVPELELISYLPEFLDGLFKYLSDPTEDVRVATENLLAEFLREMKEIAEVKKKTEEKVRHPREAETYELGRRADDRLPDITMTHPERAAFLPEGDGLQTHEGENGTDINIKDTGAYHPGQNVKVKHAEIVEILLQQLDEDHDEIQMSTALYWLAEFLHFAQDVMLPFTPRLIPAILPNLAHHVPMIQKEAIRTNQALASVIQNLPTSQPLNEHGSTDRDKASISSGRTSGPTTSPPVTGEGGPVSPGPPRPQQMGPEMPTISDVTASPASDRTVQAPARQRATTVPLPGEAFPQASPIETNSASQVQSSRSQSPTSTVASAAPSATNQPPSAPALGQGQAITQSPVQTDQDPLDYQKTVNELTLQFLSEYEETRVAALKWLIMLHQKVPRKILAMDDGTFPALLKTLSDSSDEVIKHDLQLLAQISSSSEEGYFKSFMVNLLELFSTDRRLLDHRGSLIIRQLCLNLNTERIYRTLAEILEKEEDLEFASIMVQKLNVILITSPELAEFRRRLKSLETRQDGQVLFTTLYRSWCHNAVAVFALCLLAQAYEHASNLLSIFADLEITVQLLVQVDKLVQLIESPVFTYLRLQLLEPEKYPYLFKCLYGLLMLLPQSSAFVSLRNRLNAVNSAGFLHIAPKSSANSYTGRSKLGRSEEIKWQELLTHFKSMQLRHEKLRRGEESSAYLERSDKPSMNGPSTSAPPSRPGMRRRATGNEGLPPSGLVSGAESRTGTPATNPSSGRGGILSPLNPKRVTSPSALLGFAQQQSSASRPKSPTPQAHGQNKLKRGLPGLGKGG
ncbi:ARM repeat-containing protein [Fomitiporia mediterranea MF3/22]|uniref:ARM repeat-containing protein n=1 Tax=Fomitiporia mediterranea (strain MF3/22) TaxID=694068 RepID=UPI0004409416|nr:ARM repeat-containing protein [Fomitiporia mediterranea MF3/22]EJD01507.1 ARM repeat-containing protein [Fomitiporia mediterranea MF3/22]